MPALRGTAMRGAAIRVLALAELVFLIFIVSMHRKACHVLHHGIILIILHYVGLVEKSWRSGLLVPLATGSCLPDAIAPDQRQNLVDALEN